MSKQPAWIDPIVEEIRKHSDEYAAQFDYDLEAIFLDLRRRQEEEGGEVVSFSRKESSERQDSRPGRKGR
jgi:hypothetical protein